MEKIGPWWEGEVGGRSVMSSVLLTFMVIISVSGNGNVKTCCQEVIIQLRQTTDSRSEGNGVERGGLGRHSPNHMRCFVSCCCCYIIICVVVVIAAVEGLHRINVVLQHAEA